MLRAATRTLPVLLVWGLDEVCTLALSVGAKAPLWRASSRASPSSSLAPPPTAAARVPQALRRPLAAIMPPTTRSLTAPRPTALFEACLAGNSSMTARLLEGPGAGEPPPWPPVAAGFCERLTLLNAPYLLPRCGAPDALQLVGPGNITVLHAAVMGGAAAALLLLVAAGAELDAALELGSRYIWLTSAKQARDFLESLGARRFNWVLDGSTALALAVR